MRCLLALAIALTAVERSPAQNAAVDKCQTLQHHGHLAEARACWGGVLHSPDSFTRAEGYFRLQRFDEANTEFRSADRLRPSAIVKSEWARMYFEHYQPADASKLFEEALQVDPNYVPAYLGLARVFAQNYDQRAVDLAKEALKHDGRSAAAHELLAYLALEDHDEKAATDEVQKALAISPESLDGMSVLAAMDWLRDKAQSEWADRILKINPAYGEMYAIGGHFLEINYRYGDAIPYYRRAIALNPDLWSARSKLGVDLMRLGQGAEAKQQLERCYEAHYRNAETVNSLKLLDSLQSFDVIRTAKTEIVMAKSEAPLLRLYVEPLLHRAMATYEAKYKMKLSGPVRLEVYPNKADFDVRVMALPGQGALLGVTFGSVVAMESPAARPAGDFDWGSTLWHELSHVYVLTATHNEVPRWFTEGLAVHEEGAVAPEWGDRLTPDIVTALQKKRLLPVLDLDRGFVRQQFPGQVLVSYFEAGKICDYIAERWGDGALLGMIHSYSARRTTAEAITDNLRETPAELDKDFAAWIEKQTAAATHNFDDWKRDLKAGYAALQSGKTDDAIRLGAANERRYPGYVGDHSNYELLAQAYERKSNKSKAAEELEHYRDAGGTNVQMLKDLANLEREQNHPEAAMVTLKKLNFIYPEDEEIHRMFGQLALSNGDAATAVCEDEAVLALQPTDAAQSHFELAKALRGAHRLPEARDQVVLALEAAPGFKPAQQLLLELSQ
jgi:tetratricopeptide (TPR) repeat protein